MRVVILQPSYIPWRGYFHQIQKADVFVFYDCVQYDKHGWRNRNKIKTSNGPQWLTIPVNSKGCVSAGLAIKDASIVWNANWAEKHLRSITQSYGKAPFFREYLPLVESIYGRRDEKLADFTCATTEAIARTLGIKHTTFIRSSSLPTEGTKTDRLVGILRQLGATHYVSGPSAKAYLEKEKLDEIGVSMEFIAYDYPEYPQINGPFEPQVSVLDLLFNVGPKAAGFIWANR
jgi:hypothetical protein